MLWLHTLPKNLNVSGNLQQQGRIANNDEVQQSEFKEILLIFYHTLSLLVSSEPPYEKKRIHNSNVDNILESFSDEHLIPTLGHTTSKTQGKNRLKL